MHILFIYSRLNLSSTPPHSVNASGTVLFVGQNSPGSLDLTLFMTGLGATTGGVTPRHSLLKTFMHCNYNEFESPSYTVAEQLF